MGRCFSTVYRFILVAVAIGALILTILSATSCAFVKFDHQYKGDGRMLLESNVGRKLQGETVTTEGAATDLTEGAVDATVDGTTVDEPTVDVALAGTTVDDTGIDTAADGTTVDETTTTENGTAVDESTVDSAASDPADDTASTPISPDSTGAAPVSNPVATLEDGTSPDLTGTAPVSDPAATLEDGTSPDLTGAAPVSDPAAIIEDGFSPEFTGSATSSETTYTPEGSTTTVSETQYTTGGSISDVNPFPYAEAAAENAEQEAAAVAEVNATANTVAEVEQEAVAIISGDAGLFCDGETSFSVTNLWGGSIKDLEDKIADESQSNQSEELARNAAISAAVFGSAAAALLMFESIIGWRMCLDRWIIGALSMMACISQGVTFLFFNSERYCDGDIVHEILNQEPCVIGEGGTLSIVALVLYFIMVVMCCRLPQDDPFGLCCMKDDKSSSATSDKASTGGSGKFGLLGSKSDAKDDASARSEQKPERPNWLSEDKRKETAEGQVEDENEII